MHELRESRHMKAGKGMWEFGILSSVLFLFEKRPSNHTERILPPAWWYNFE